MKNISNSRKTVYYMIVCDCVCASFLLSFQHLRQSFKTTDEGAEESKGLAGTFGYI